VAQEHLALERTFLAYIRTSLAVFIAGIALTRFRTIADIVAPLGAAVVLLSLGILWMGTIRYYSVQRVLLNGSFPISQVAISATFSPGTAVIASFGIITTGMAKVV